VSMFQKSVLKSISQNESLVAQRWAEFQKYLSKLSYTLDNTNPNDFNLERETRRTKQTANRCIVFDYVIISGDSFTGV